MGRLQGLMESGDISEMMNNPEALLDGIAIPEETNATRAINAATSVLLAFFDAAAKDITETLLGPRPALLEAYARHRRSDARGEDAAAALFGISTQGPTTRRPHSSSRRSSPSTRSVCLARCCAWTVYRAPANLMIPNAWYERVTNITARLRGAL